MYRRSARLEERLLSLLRQCLPDHDRIHLRGAIPQHKLETVTMTYRLAELDTVLAVYDDTVFGSAEDGFVFTLGHFGFKQLAEAPVLLDLRRLDRDDVELRDGQLYVKHARLPINAGADEAAIHAGVAAALGGMMDRLGRDPAPRRATAGEPWSAAGLLALLTEELPAHGDVYFRGRIPGGKLSTVCRVYRLEDRSAVLALYDDTLFGSAAEGFVFTDTHFGFKAIAEPPVLLSLEGLHLDHIRRDGEHLSVKGRGVEITGPARRALTDGLQRVLEWIASRPR